MALSKRKSRPAAKSDAGPVYSELMIYLLALDRQARDYGVSARMDQAGRLITADCGMMPLRMYYDRSDNQPPSHMIAADIMSAGSGVLSPLPNGLLQSQPFQLLGQTVDCPEILYTLVRDIEHGHTSVTILTTHDSVQCIFPDNPDIVPSRVYRIKLSVAGSFTSTQVTMMELPPLR